MTIQNLALFFALITALAYGSIWCLRTASIWRTLIKTAAVSGLAVWAWTSGGPILLVLALSLSAAGDAFLAGNKDRWLLPGMAAFFAAHIAYIFLFKGAGLVSETPLIIALQVALAIGTLLLITWLLPKLGSFTIPVLAYSLIIFAMGFLAFLLPDHLRWASWGAAAFIASDALLSVELFARPESAPDNPITARLVWGLYFGGQALITTAFLGLG